MLRSVPRVPENFTPDNTPEIPMVIAPWTYFADLQERTGDTTSTPESIVRFVLENNVHEVTIAKHLIALGSKEGIRHP